MNDLTIHNAALIPFEDDMELPAYLRDMESDLQAYTAGVTAGFPVLSIKGKSFAVVRDGQRTIVTRADDPDAPANYIDAIFLKSNPALSKVYYLKGYEEGSVSKPDCSSTNSVHPDPGVPEPQSKSCATCPHNAFGSGQGGKGKACQDSRRIAVVALSALDDPMLLRVPPGSFKNLSKYAQQLSVRGVKSAAAVLTRVKFDPEEATPRLVFNARALLGPDAIAEVQRIAATELVSQIIGVTPLPHDEDDTPEELPQVSLADVAKAVAPKPEPKPAAPKPEPKPAAKPKPVAEPKPEPKAAKPKATVEDLDSLNAALDDLLSEYDG